MLKPSHKQNHMYTLAALYVCGCGDVREWACKPVVVAAGMGVFTNVRMSLRQTIECEQNFHQVTTKNFSTVLFLFVRSR